MGIDRGKKLTFFCSPETSLNIFGSVGSILLEMTTGNIIITPPLVFSTAGFSIGAYYSKKLGKIFLALIIL